MTSDHNLPRVRIIMVTYNSVTKLGGYFDKVLSGIAELNYDYDKIDVVIVDNNSSDNTAKHAEKTLMSKDRTSKVNVIKLNRNVGLPKGYNVGATTSKSKIPKYFLFINDDVILTQEVINRLVSVMERDKTIGAASPLIIHPDGRHEVGFEAGLTGYVRPLQPRKPYKELIDVFAIAGCSLIVKSQLFFEIGGFDPHFFWGYDDVDLCWRIHSKGFRTVVVTTVHVHHYGSATLGKENPVKYYLGIRNWIWMYFKNHSLKMAILLAPILLGEILVILLWKLIKRDGATTRAIVKGVMDSIKHLPFFIKGGLISYNKDKLEIIKLMKPYVDAKLLMSNILR